MPGGVRPFSDVLIGGMPLWEFLDSGRPLRRFEDLLKVLEFLHIAEGLLAPYSSRYPLVEPRELIPPFDAPLIEYKELPAFSMLALDRQLSYMDEGFQFDILLPEGTPPDPRVISFNRRAIRRRLPRNIVRELERVIGRRAITPVSHYHRLLKLLVRMDRGHLIARAPDGSFYLAGIYASFPSDLDGEIKRFGRQIGKFIKGDNESYLRNRQFVYHFLMEQMGFPICGERHTSAALFARRLMRRRERFVVKVLGHSDRTITTLTSEGASGRLPVVQKVALVSAAGCPPEKLKELGKGGFFVDRRRKVVILRVYYQQHAYHKDNILEERALSVLNQEVIHPRTGEVLEGMDVLGLSQDRLLLLNDIVRGEHRGSIVYRGRERVVGTASTRNRLKFLAAWLRKHRSILADYAPENFERVVKVLSSYLDDPARAEEFARYQRLYEEVKQAFAELKVAHRLRLLERLITTRTDHEGRRLTHVQLLVVLVHILSEEAGALLKHYPKAMRKLLRICRKYMNDPYLRRRYLSRPPRTTYEHHLRAEYAKLSELVRRYEQMLQAPSPSKASSATSAP